MHRWLIGSIWARTRHGDTPHAPPLSHSKCVLPFWSFSTLGKNDPKCTAVNSQVVFTPVDLASSTIMSRECTPRARRQMPRTRFPQPPRCGTSRACPAGRRTSPWTKAPAQTTRSARHLRSAVVQRGGNNEFSRAPAQGEDSRRHMPPVLHQQCANMQHAHPHECQRLERTWVDCEVPGVRKLCASRACHVFVQAQPSRRCSRVAPCCTQAAGTRTGGGDQREQRS